MSDLANFTTPQLKKILTGEHGVLPKRGNGKNGNVLKKDIMNAIVNNRLQKEDYLSTLPQELRFVIGKDIPITDIPGLCRSSKSFREQCKNIFFWSYYLYRPTTGESQELFHQQLIQLAEGGDIELFGYIWDTPIVVGKELLVKERRSLFGAYIEALRVDKRKTAAFIWSLDPDFIKRMTVNKLWLEENENEYSSDELIKLLQLKENLIGIIKSGNINKFKKFPVNLRSFNEDTWDDIFSYSPSWKFLKKSVNTINYWPSRRTTNEASRYNEIVILAIKNGNTLLVKSIKPIFGDFFDFLYIYFLRSPRPDGDILAELSGGINNYDAGSIGYYFGNGNIMLKYIKKYPEDKEITLIKSIKALPPDELINAFLKEPGNKCLGPLTLERWIEDASYWGYDYLIKLLETKIPICDNEIKQILEED